MKNVIEINPMAFQPSSLTVKCGECVTWDNCDGDNAHTVTSDQPAAQSEGDPGYFDSGDIDPGASYDMTFTKVGTYPYHCAKTPRMNGTIIVV